MSEEEFEIVRGSGNVFRDFNHANAELEQLRAVLAAAIIKTLDNKKLTVRKAHELTGFAAADFSRVRSADLGRFTVDRLMTMLDKLGTQYKMEVTFPEPSKRVRRMADA